MEFADLDLIRLAPAYLPVLARVGAVVAIAPPFASAAVPPRVRVIIALALTVGLMPTIAARPMVPSSVGQVFIAVGTEALIGLAIGLAIRLVFAAAQWAGEIIAQQMGLSLAESFDPRAGGDGTSIGQLYWLLATVVFLGANGHHALLRGLTSSFDVLPVGQGVASMRMVDLLVGLVQSCSILALQLAAPVIITLLMVDLSMGMVGKAMPQIGVMSAGVTMRSIAGLIVLIAGVALTVRVIQGATLNWMQLVQSQVSSLAGK